MIRTFETRLDLRGRSDLSMSSVLDQYAGLMARAERVLLAKLSAGRKWTGDLHISLYEPLGLTATHLNMVHRQLQGKLGSVKELAKGRVVALDYKIKSKLADIGRRQKAVASLLLKRAKLPVILRDLEKKVALRRQSLSVAKEADVGRYMLNAKFLLDKLHGARAMQKTISTEIGKVRFALHQHKRRLSILRRKRLEAFAQAADPALCFGSNKLFRGQFNLDGNGYADREEWLRDWRAARSSSMTFEGDSSRESGNPFARLKRRDDGLFDLELRLPPGLAHLAQRSFKVSGNAINCVDFRGLSFNHGDGVIERVLESGRPVTVKFLRDAKSWKVCVTVDHVMSEVAADFSRGALGVDMNAGHIAAAFVDADGNPVRTYTFPCVTYGKTANQAKDAVRKVAAEIADLASKLGVPVVSERLDFSKKKAALKTSDGPRYARMISSFAYSAFDAALSSACLRTGVAHRRVNPAYTSIIGRVTFASRYGLSVHHAASVSIARRAMDCSERMPRSSEGTVKVPMNDAVQVTLPLPVRNVGKHVWTAWNGLNKEYLKRALAARRPSGRRSPRPAPASQPVSGRSRKPLHGLMVKSGRSR